MLLRGFSCERKLSLPEKCNAQWRLPDMGVSNRFPDEHDVSALPISRLRERALVRGRLRQPRRSFLVRFDTSSRKRGREQLCFCVVSFAGPFKEKTMTLHSFFRSCGPLFALT